MRTMSELDQKAQRWLSQFVVGAFFHLKKVP